GPAVRRSHRAPVGGRRDADAHRLELHCRSVLKLFIATAMGTVARGPYSPTTWRSDSLTFSPLDPTIPLGRGFATAMIINTDQGFTTSKTRGQYLYGSASANIPTITAIGGGGLWRMQLASPPPPACPQPRERSQGDAPGT